MKSGSCLLGLLVLIALIPIHGYWYSTSVIHKYIDRCGAYPSLDQAIQSDWRHNGFDPAWFVEYLKGPNRDNVPYTWYVVYKVKPEYQQVQKQALQALRDSNTPFCGGSFYEHTRWGWVGMPEHFLNAWGYLDLWMKVYHLYGSDALVSAERL